VLLLALPALAGCSGTHGGGAAVPALDFGAMSVTTVPVEPADRRGAIAVAWQDGLMAVATSNEGGMPAQAVVDGGRLYTTQAGMGWTQWLLADQVATSPRGFRFLALDAPRLLAGAHVSDATATWFRAAASYDVGHHLEAVTLEVNHTGPAVADVRILAPQDPESPYTLRPLGHAFPFAVAVPTPVRPAAEVERLDAQARDGQAQILGWIRQYRDQTGTLPQQATPDSLALQRLGAPWPTDPYDGQPMADRQASGDFRWLRCSDADGSFHAFGWDGAPLNQDFGRGCAG
jgi:hypothetical protein